jgi:hypothetical protein
MRYLELDSALIWAGRLLVSEHLIRNKDQDRNGITVDIIFQSSDESMSTEEYCEKKILVWGTDAESPFIEIGALEESLCCECSILYLNRDGAILKKKYELEESKRGRGSVALFLKPGHYDLLCQRDTPRPKNIDISRSFIRKIQSAKGFDDNINRIRIFLCKSRSDEEITIENFNAFL